MRRGNGAATSRREVVVVTGADAGLGRAIAREFAAHGAAVGIIARDRERVSAAAAEMREYGGEGHGVVADVADAQAVERAAAEFEERLGAIDVWVNNAMVSVFAEVKDTTNDEFKRVTEVTYLGVVYGTKAALARMLPRDHGTIVQVGSALAWRSIPLQSAYCAAKHAIVGFTDSLRSELIHDKSGVQVRIVHMPALNTPQFDWERSRLPRKPQPVPPIYQPEVGARAVYWAAHHDRPRLAVGWSSLKAIWGQKLVPGWLDRYLAKAAYSGQQHDGQADADRPDNLFAPVPGEYGAHGSFDARARPRSLELWLSEHRGAVGLTAAVGVALAGLRRVLR